MRRAFEELREETSNFTTKKNIDLEDVQTDRYKLIALRLISGRNTEETALIIDIPFQTLLKWESGKARTPLPPNTAERMVLRCDFQDFRKHGPANPLITRFFKECSLLDMKTPGRSAIRPQPPQRHFEALQHQRVGSIDNLPA